MLHVTSFCNNLHQAQSQSIRKTSNLKVFGSKKIQWASTENQLMSSMPEAGEP